MATWLVKFHAVKATKRCLKSHQLFWTKKIPIAGKLYFDDSKREKKTCGASANLMFLPMRSPYVKII